MVAWCLLGLVFYLKDNSHDFDFTIEVRARKGIMRITTRTGRQPRTTENRVKSASEVFEVHVGGV